MFVGNISYGLLNKFKLYVSLTSKKSCEDMYTSYNCGNKSGNYVSFFHHYQGSIDFNTVNIHHPEGMYFLVSTGNRDDIE